MFNAKNGEKMDNSILISLSAQNALMRKMEVAANNMANISTIGYKAESVLFQPFEKKPASIIERPTTVDFVRDYTISRDFRAGALQRTDNPLDVALTGDGFFTVQGRNGPTYSRDGRFTLDPNGRLINHNGSAVLDNNGAEINIDPRDGQIIIAKDGSIKQNGPVIATIGIVNFERPGALKKTGDNLYEAPQGVNPIPAESFELVQGMVEGSNVVPVRQLTEIMEISRAFESAARLQKQTEDLRSRAIERLARVQA